MRPRPRTRRIDRRGAPERDPPRRGRAPPPRSRPYPRSSPSPPVLRCTPWARESPRSQPSTRRTTRGRGGRPAPANASDDALEPADVSYYVRYVGFDKRLDEWIPGTNVEPYTAAVGEETGPAPWTRRSAASACPAAILSPAPLAPTRAPGEKLTRNLKRRYNEINNVAGDPEDLTPLDQKLEHEHDERTKVKNVGVVECGRFEVDAWYYSPYPGEYGEANKLFVCERCLKYMRKRKTLLAHREGAS